MKRIAAILLTAVLVGAGCSDNGVSPSTDTGPGRVVIAGSVTRMDTGEESQVRVTMYYEALASFSTDGSLNVVTEPVQLSVWAQDPILKEGASVLDAETLLLSFNDRPYRTTEVRGNLSGSQGNAIRWMARCRNQLWGWIGKPPHQVFTSETQVTILVSSQGQNYFYYGTSLRLGVTGTDHLAK
jgi:hypothetical protein